MKNTSITLSGDIEKKLNKICVETGASKSATIRKLIEDYDKEGSAYQKKKIQTLEDITLTFKQNLEDSKREREFLRKSIIALLGGRALELANNARKNKDLKFAEWLLH